MSYHLIAWNVNGYSPKVHSWLLKYVEDTNPDVIFLSETKKAPGKLPFDQFENYSAIVNSHIPARWHGVAMLIRKDRLFDRLEVEMKIHSRKDTHSPDPCCGRVIAIRMEGFNIIGTYTPNSGGLKDEVKHSYRVQTWDPEFVEVLQELKSLGPTIWIGDINVALDDIDVSDPRRMSLYAGFTQAERDNLRALLETGEWIDVWRKEHPGVKTYTWVGSKHSPLTYGLRLDNVIASSDVIDIHADMIVDSCPDSDHIPVVAKFSDLIF